MYRLRECYDERCESPNLADFADRRVHGRDRWIPLAECLQLRRDRDHDAVRAGGRYRQPGDSEVQDEGGGAMMS